MSPPPVTPAEPALDPSIVVSALLALLLLVWLAAIIRDGLRAARAEPDPNSPFGDTTNWRL